MIKLFLPHHKDGKIRWEVTITKIACTLCLKFLISPICVRMYSYQRLRVCIETMKVVFMKNRNEIKGCVLSDMATPLSSVVTYNQVQINSFHAGSARINEMRYVHLAKCA